MANVTTGAAIIADQLEALKKANISIAPIARDNSLEWDDNLIQMKATERSLPDIIVEAASHAQSRTASGIIPETHHIWVTVDRILFLWNYKSNHHPLVIECDGIITAVDFLRPTPGVFHESVNFLGIIVSQHSIEIIGLGLRTQAQLLIDNYSSEGFLSKDLMSPSPSHPFGPYEPTNKVGLCLVRVSLLSSSAPVDPVTLEPVQQDGPSSEYSQDKNNLKRMNLLPAESAPSAKWRVALNSDCGIISMITHTASGKILMASTTSPDVFELVYSQRSSLFSPRCFVANLTKGGTMLSLLKGWVMGGGSKSDKHGGRQKHIRTVRHLSAFSEEDYFIVVDSLPTLRLYKLGGDGGANSESNLSSLETALFADSDSQSANEDVSMDRQHRFDNLISRFLQELNNGSSNQNIASSTDFLIEGPLKRSRFDEDNNTTTTIKRTRWAADGAASSPFDSAHAGQRNQSLLSNGQSSNIDAMETSWIRLLTEALKGLRVDLIREALNPPLAAHCVEARDAADSRVTDSQKYFPNEQHSANGNDGDRISRKSGSGLFQWLRSTLTGAGNSSTEVDATMSSKLPIISSNSGAAKMVAELPLSANNLQAILQNAFADIESGELDEVRNEFTRIGGAGESSSNAPPVHSLLNDISAIFASASDMISVSENKSPLPTESKISSTNCYVSSVSARLSFDHQLVILLGLSNGVVLTLLGSWLSSTGPGNPSCGGHGVPLRLTEGETSETHFGLWVVHGKQLLHQITMESVRIPFANAPTDLESTMRTRMLLQSNGIYISQQISDVANLNPSKIRPTSITNINDFNAGYSVNRIPTTQHSSLNVRPGTDNSFRIFPNLAANPATPAFNNSIYDNMLKFTPAPHNNNPSNTTPLSSKNIFADFAPPTALRTNNNNKSNNNNPSTPLISSSNLFSSLNKQQQQQQPTYNPLSSPNLSLINNNNNTQINNNNINTHVSKPSTISISATARIRTRGLVDLKRSLHLPSSPVASAEELQLAVSHPNHLHPAPWPCRVSVSQLLEGTSPLIQTSRSVVILTETSIHCISLDWTPVSLSSSSYSPHGGSGSAEETPEEICVALRRDIAPANAATNQAQTSCFRPLINLDDVNVRTLVAQQRLPADAPPQRPAWIIRPSKWSAGTQLCVASLVSPIWFAPLLELRAAGRFGSAFGVRVAIPSETLYEISTALVNALKVLASPTANPCATDEEVLVHLQIQSPAAERLRKTCSPSPAPAVESSSSSSYESALRKAKLLEADSFDALLSCTSRIVQILRIVSLCAAAEGSQWLTPPPKTSSKRRMGVHMALNNSCRNGLQQILTADAIMASITILVTTPLRHLLASTVSDDGTDLCSSIGSRLALQLLKACAHTACSTFGDDSTRNSGLMSDLVSNYKEEESNAESERLEWFANVFKKLAADTPLLLALVPSRALEELFAVSVSRLCPIMLFSSSASGKKVCEQLLQIHQKLIHRAFKNSHIQETPTDSLPLPIPVPGVTISSFKQSSLSSILPPVATAANAGLNNREDLSVGMRSLKRDGSSYLDLQSMTKNLIQQQQQQQQQQFINYNNNIQQLPETQGMNKKEVTAPPAFSFTGLTMMNSFPDNKP